MRSSFLPDFRLTIPAILLITLSVLVLYTSDITLAISQGIFAIIGLLIFYFLSLIDFESYNDYIWLFYFGVIVLMVITYIIGFETRGSVRWIPLGVFQIQPSEFAKPVLILLLSKFWNSRPTNWLNISKSMLLVAPFIFLVFKQPDLGTALIIGVIWIFCLLGANVSFKKLSILTVFFLPLIPLGNFILKDYQKQRFLSFLSPANDPLGAGYNVIQSTIAVGSGGLWGRGLGRGTQSRLQFLPEYRTDFVFASIAEEMGFLASLIILILYGLILTRVLQIAAKSESRFYGVLSMGVLGMLFFQMTVNIGMNVGIMPVTGITLPLLSYGGSSMIVTLVSLSFIAAAARYGRR